MIDFVASHPDSAELTIALGLVLLLTASLMGGLARILIMGVIVSRIVRLTVIAGLATGVAGIFVI